MEKLFIIIDGNSLINRAYYAIQRPMITKSGIYTQGIYGFISMLNKMLEEYKPTHIAVAFDKKGPTFRHKEYEAYKAGRKSMPEELAMQMPIMKDILNAMNIKTLELDGYEADDILGSLAKEGENMGVPVMIVTGDKDALQLATEKTKILITKKGISEFDLYDANKMVEVYGFTPGQFIDFKGLRGDTSDNIPGIAGIGDKTATKLITEYGSIEEIYKNIEKVSPKGTKAKLENNMDIAYLSKKLATIDVDVPINFILEEFEFEAPDYSLLLELYRKLEFRAFMKKLSEKINMEEISIEESMSPSTNKKADIIKTDRVKTYRIEKENLAELDKIAGNNKTAILSVFHDGNHKGTPEIYAVSLLFVEEKEYVYIPTPDEEAIIEFINILKDKKIKIWGHDLTETLYPLIYTIYEHGQSFIKERFFDIGFDSAVAQYLLEPARSTYELSAMLLERLNIGLKSHEKQIDIFNFEKDVYFEEGLERSVGILNLENILISSIKKEDMEKVFYDIELPLIEVLASMEAKGFSASAEILEIQGADLNDKLEILRTDIYKAAGEEFNINSPKQLGNILFEKLRLPHGKKNKSGYSTDIEVLEKLKNDNPIVADIIEYRGLSKLLSTYVTGLISMIGEDGRIHPHFKQTVTATGRISCVEPNLQNIPIRQEVGRNIRKAFLPKAGSVLIGADYSQIELRVLAHLSEDDKLIEAFQNGEDIHKSTAARVFGTEKDDVTPLQRSRAKAINFGVIYGMSNFGLSNELNISRKEAEEYIKEYFNLHRNVKAFMDMQVAMAKAEGYTITITGRKRLIPEINAKNYMMRQMGERLAMNSPIQGSAADIIKLAMNKVYDKLIEEKLESSLILQIHDELIIETRIDEMEKVTELLKEAMEQAIELMVPLTVDINKGENWYQLK